MAPYWFIDFEYFILALICALLIIVLVILARGSLRFSFSFKKRSDKEIEESLHHFGGDVSETNRPMPLLIWVITVGYVIWAFSYVFYISKVGY